MSFLTFDTLSGATPNSKPIISGAPKPGATWPFDLFRNLQNLPGILQSGLQVTKNENPVTVHRIFAQPSSSTPYPVGPDTRSRVGGNHHKDSDPIQPPDPQSSERLHQGAEPQSQQVNSLHNTTSSASSPSNTSSGPNHHLVDASSSPNPSKSYQKQSSSGNTRSEVPPNDPRPLQLENVSPSPITSQMATSPDIAESLPLDYTKELVAAPELLKQALGPSGSTPASPGKRAIPFSTLPSKEVQPKDPTNATSVAVPVKLDGSGKKDNSKSKTLAQKSADGVIALKPLGTPAGVVAEGLRGSRSNKVFENPGVVADGIKGTPSRDKTSKTSSEFPASTLARNSSGVQNIRGAPKNGTNTAIPKSSSIFSPAPGRILGIDKKIFLFGSGIIGACLMAALIGFLVQCSKGTKRRKEDKALEDESDFLQANTAPWIDSKSPAVAQEFKPVASSYARRSEDFYDKHHGHGQDRTRDYMHEAEPYDDNGPISQSYGPRSFPVTAYDDVASECYYPPQKGYLDLGNPRDSASINIEYYEESPSPNRWDRHRTSVYENGPSVGMRSRQAPISPGCGTPTDFYESSIGNARRSHRQHDGYRTDQRRMDERQIPDHRRFEDSQSYDGSDHLYSPEAYGQPRIQLRPPAPAVRHDDIFPAGGNKSISRRPRERQEEQGYYDSRASSFLLAADARGGQDSRPRPNQARLHEAVEDLHRNLIKPKY